MNLLFVNMNQNRRRLTDLSSTFLGAAILFMLAGCISGSPPMEYVLDLEDGFKNNPVKVSADNKLLFDGEVSSDPVIGLAKRIRIGQCNELEVRVSVDGRWIGRKILLHPSRGRNLGIGIDIDWGESYVTYRLTFEQAIEHWTYM